MFFRTPSIVSEVLNGKRGLTIEQIKKLGRRFHVSPEVVLLKRSTSISVLKLFDNVPSRTY